MARPYSMELRNRVVAAVDGDGLSRHGAAARYGVAPATAIRWMRDFRLNGHAAPGQMGGYKPKTLIGVHRDWLIERCNGRDFTLRGLVLELAERGLKVDYRSVWAFVHAEKLSFKKKPGRRRAGSARHRPAAVAVAKPPASD